MSTELRDQDAVTALPKVDNLRVGIAVAQWNTAVTEALLDGALARFDLEGYSRDSITVERVPGTVELPFAAAQMCRSGNFDAVIVIGCVIRGGTPHFDYVCDSVTQGVAHLNTTQDVPVIFCVLTTDNEQQALDRAGGFLCNKGTDAAEAAVTMAALARKYRK